MKTDELIAEVKRIAEDDSPDGGSYLEAIDLKIKNIMQAAELYLATVDYNFPIVRGLAPNQEHVYCTDCGELLTQRHECKTPRGGFEFL